MNDKKPTIEGIEAVNNIFPIDSIIFVFSLIALMFIVLVCFYPNMLGHTDNYIPANPMVTPAHIVPE